MAETALLIDFGSTFTKVTAVDLAKAEVLGRSQAPSTVLTDVRDGLLRALAELHATCALFNASPRDLSALDGLLVLASSSAAGGLRIAVVGNVPGLTVEAANQSALGAGAKVVGAASFKLAAEKIADLENLRPDMILLTGGVDGGDSETILHNARMLADSALAAPTVVAGNRAAASEVCAILEAGGKEFCLINNVMPRAGTLAVEAAREEIRRLFMERITRAKGLDQLSGLVPVVLPTPMAVLDGVRLGADGAGGQAGWGDLLVVDVGGATTDVHSVGFGQPVGEHVIAQGVPEAYAKRTVEGDLGIRFNAATILNRVGRDELAGDLRRDFPAVAPPTAEFLDYIESISRDTDLVPQQPWHAAADAVLARAAAGMAVARHVGRRERIVAQQGEAWMHSGKDLRDTRIVIGTGGVFVHNPHAAYILSPKPEADDRVQVLRPRKAKMFLDSSYLLYAVGLLAERYPEAALALFKRYLRPAA